MKKGLLIIILVPMLIGCGIENLRQIVAQTSAKIIISSTWRNSSNVSHNHPLYKYWRAIMFNLGKIGLDRDIIDTTPWLGGNRTRGEEILVWLKERFDTISLSLDYKIGDGNFVIIDDDKDMGCLMEYLAHCGPDGITDEVRDMAISILNKN